MILGKYFQPEFWGMLFTSIPIPSPNVEDFRKVNSYAVFVVVCIFLSQLQWVSTSELHWRWNLLFCSADGVGQDVDLCWFWQWLLLFFSSSQKYWGAFLWSSSVISVGFLGNKMTANMGEYASAWGPYPH